MKKSQLKVLIKECVREVILEESGIIAHLVTETAKGLTTQPVIRETKSAKFSEDVELARMKAVNEATSTKVSQRRRMLDDAIGADAYGGIDLFEGVDPIKSAGRAETAPSSDNSALAGISPDDPGIDISGIMDVGNAGNWNRIVKGK